MKKLLILILCLGAGVSGGHAQQANSFSGSLLWKISGKDLSSASYILGTHHLTSLNFADSIPGLKSAMEASRQFVGEMDVKDFSDLQSLLMKRATMSQGENYRSLLSAQEYETLDNGLKNLIGVGLDRLGMLQPGVIDMVVSVAIYAKTFPGINLMNLEAMDVSFLKRAADRGIPVIGLETPEEQFHALLDTEPLQVQAKHLVCSISNLGYAENANIRLNRNYRQGNLNEMYASFHDPDDPCLMSDAQKNALVRDRNNLWLEKLPAIMHEHPSLIAVGALHLAGEEGLLYQLSKMGYTVEAVK